MTKAHTRNSGEVYLANLELLKSLEFQVGFRFLTEDFALGRRAQACRALGLRVSGCRLEVEVGNVLGMHSSQEGYKETARTLWKNASGLPPRCFLCDCS